MSLDTRYWRSVLTWSILISSTRYGAYKFYGKFICHFLLNQFWCVGYWPDFFLIQRSVDIFTNCRLNKYFGTNTSGPLPLMYDTWPLMGHLVLFKLLKKTHFIKPSLNTSFNNTWRVVSSLMKCVFKALLVQLLLKHAW